MLGRLDPAYFLGGEMALDPDRVRRAFADGVAAKLNLGVMDAALGVQRIVDETMAAATRMHLAEKGRDPRRYTLIAFGGAGPVHAWNLARLLKINRVVVPLGAGVASALGLPRRAAGDRHGAQPGRVGSNGSTGQRSTPSSPRWRRRAARCSPRPAPIPPPSSSAPPPTCAMSARASRCR